jgi:hypothetical protein
MTVSDVRRLRSSAIGLAVTVVATVVAALYLAVAPAASAQTAFAANVNATTPMPVGCSSGAFFCGTATIAGYGTGTWAFDLDTFSPTLDPTSCGSTYTASVDFTLASDGSTLALNESGNVCAPGKDGISLLAPPPTSFGHPFQISGTWTVDPLNSSGRFAGLGGFGTDALQGAGSYTTGSYSGVLD